ncbi:MAG: hypothetical protein EOO45_18785 [Flavobacterium sp.]|nr:MAG: hypothetical protein EOO45_18785 [Flavobacterium sp.]
MENNNKPLRIRFYNEEMFDSAMLFMEAEADCLLGDMNTRITLENYPAEYTAMGSGTPDRKREVDIGYGFYEVMKQVFADDPVQEHFTFHIETKIQTAETSVRQLEAKHTVRVKNPLLGVPRTEWPEWDEPQFEIPEIIPYEVPKQDAFTISVSPQYTGGDIWNFLDVTDSFTLSISSDMFLKKIDVTARLMHDWREEKLSVEATPQVKEQEIKVGLSKNLLDQIKDLGSYSHGENEKFDYFFELEITDSENKKHKRKTSVKLPNPYYEGIASEKAIAREALAEVFRRKYGEDVAELDMENQPGWWTWKKEGADFQYGWKEDAIVLYRYFGAADYNADEDEMDNAMDELTEFADGAGDFVFVDNYFVLSHEFSPEWMDADDLEKKLIEFEEFANSKEVAKFLSIYEGES